MIVGIVVGVLISSLNLTYKTRFEISTIYYKIPFVMIHTMELFTSIDGLTNSLPYNAYSSANCVDSPASNLQQTDTTKEQSTELIHMLLALRVKRDVHKITDFVQEIQDPDVLNYYYSLIFPYNIIFYDSSITVDMSKDATPVPQENNPENSQPSLFDRVY